MGRLTTLKPRIPTLGAAPAKQGGWSATRQTSSAERGYGWAWQKLRLRILKRDCYLCQVCQRADRVREAREVDHIVGKDEWQLERGSLVGCDDPSNLQSICKACHTEKTAQEAARARARSAPLVQLQPRGGGVPARQDGPPSP